MKFVFVVAGFFAASIISCQQSTKASIPETDQAKDSTSSEAKPVSESLYLDVHHMGAGKVKVEDVANAHVKDLATQGKYGVHFIKYWVDEAAGDVYCLASSPDSQLIRNVHAEAHGLLPNQVSQVTDGQEAALNGQKNFFLDVHELGVGKVTAKDVAGAHQKDLAVQDKYGVNLINYWVNEKSGRIVCLSQAPDSSAIIKTHKEAHGLLPARVIKVKQGQ